MSFPRLQENSIYILVYVRNDPHVPDNFHWTFYHHRNPLTGGVKYHIRNEGDGWMPGHGPIVAISKEFLLVGLMRVADVPAGVDHAAVDGIMKTFDDELNTPGQTCRVWLLRVLELLRRPVLGSSSCSTAGAGSAAGAAVPTLRCDDVAALEAEVMAWGNQHAQSAIDNVQPRPVSASKAAGCRS